MAATEHTERYVTAFKNWQGSGRKSEPSWISELRQEGISSFSSSGFPTTKDEAWKYTNVGPVVARPFDLANGAPAHVDGADVLTAALVEADALRLVFVNGRYAPGLSSVGALPRGARVASLAELRDRNDEVLESQIGRHANHRRNAFVALNTAFIDDGAVVFIPPGCRLARPLYLVYVSGAEHRPIVSHPRTLIYLGAASEATIIECYAGLNGGTYAGLNGGTYLCNAVTELIGEADALARHYRLQREGGAAFHVGTLAASLQRGCHLTAHAVTLSGALVRNDVHVSLDGEGAECVLNGLYLGAGRQHIDNFTEIEHVRPRARSLELYKGILDGASHGVFNGKIVVHKDAQKSDAHQTNRNLLLSADAVVNTKPQLEIYADDVKCTHGSTIGQLDPDALFYLRSRGLGLDEARTLLSFAFASDIVGRMSNDALRRRLDEYLVARFSRKERLHEGNS